MGQCIGKSEIFNLRKTPQGCEDEIIRDKLRVKYGSQYVLCRDKYNKQYLRNHNLFIVPWSEAEHIINEVQYNPMTKDEIDVQVLKMARERRKSNELYVHHFIR